MEESRERKGPCTLCGVDSDTQWQRTYLMCDYLFDVTCSIYSHLIMAMNVYVARNCPVEFFLQDHYSCVFLSSVLSVCYPEENMVPQGSILSATLFAVAINGTVNAVGP
jgi:hypothetical protein